MARAPGQAETMAAGSPAAAPRLMVFVPMYNCAPQIARVIGQFDAATQARFERLVVVDNRSTDDGLARAAAALTGLCGIDTVLLQNDANYGLGGSHKVAFLHALENGFDGVVVLHGDDQGSIADLVPHLKEFTGADCLLGARFMTGSHLAGYSAFRTLGNRVFNGLFSVVAGRMLYDLGSGLNLYATRALAGKGWLGFADDLTFNYYLILASVAWGWRTRFFPISWREDDQISNVKLVRQAKKTLGILAEFALSRQAFLQRDHRTARPLPAYTATVIQSTMREREGTAA